MAEMRARADRENEKAAALESGDEGELLDEVVEEEAMGCESSEEGYEEEEVLVEELKEESEDGEEDEEDEEKQERDEVKCEDEHEYPGVSSTHKNGKQGTVGMRL